MKEWILQEFEKKTKKNILRKTFCCHKRYIVQVLFTLPSDSFYKYFK